MFCVVLRRDSFGIYILYVLDQYLKNYTILERELQVFQCSCVLRVLAELSFTLL